MRTATLALAATLLVLSGCGSDPEPSSVATADTVAPTPGASASTASPSEVASPSRPASGQPATAAQIQSVIDDVQAYAPAMEQVYFSDGYPDDLAGARRTAAQLTNLRLSPGNRIAGYRYDAGDREFRLCIENTSGAYAVYDTSPMSTIDSGRSGGCPG